MSQKLALCETPNPGSSRLKGWDLGQFPGSSWFKRREICMFPILVEQKVNEPGSFRFKDICLSILGILFKNIVFYDTYLNHMVLSTFRGALSLKRTI